MKRFCTVLLMAVHVLVLNPACTRSRLDTWQPDSSLFEETPGLSQSMPTPTPEPTPVPTLDPSPEPQTEEVSDTEKAPKRSFFGRLFGRKSDAEPDPTPTPESTDPGGVPTAVPTPNSGVYRLLVGDTVYITLSGALGPTEQLESAVDDRGFVKLRFIGAVKAQGLTATELEREIEAEYTERQNIFKEIYARVMVPNTSYFIGGEVRMPNRYPLVGRVTLSQAIVAAGNFTEWAEPRRLVIVRNNERIEINFRTIRDDPTLDVELRAGDVITVERSRL